MRRWAWGTGMIIKKVFVRGLAMLLFGLVLPLVLAFRADARMDFAQDVITRAAEGSFIMKVFSETPEKFKNGNDYAMVALADSERANLVITVNKQIMKLVVIYLGFSVMSFAMMFIVLGFTDAPVAVAGEGAGLKLDFKFGSIGAAVFVVGAAMSAGGGLIPNEYRTVGVPAFIALTKQQGALDPLAVCNLIPDEVERGACLNSKPETAPAPKP
jgi:hypothetical protein